MTQLKEFKAVVEAVQKQEHLGLLELEVGLNEQTLYDLAFEKLRSVDGKVTSFIKSIISANPITITRKENHDN